MSNVGKQFPSEMSTYIDKKSGKEVIKLTESGVNFHFYFTENSFNTGDKEIIYLHSDEHLSNVDAFQDLYSMNLQRAVLVQF
jgi:oligogalacturonide lyase